MDRKMKTHLTKSWRTTICGIGTATGLGIMGAPLIGWINGDHRHSVMVVGWCLCVTFAVLQGIVSRDHGVSSEVAGVKH